MNITQQPLTKELKKQIFEGFSYHAISKTGHDEKFDSEAFIATDDEKFVGAIVVEKFWGALHIKYVYVEDKYRNLKVASRLMKAAFEFGRAHKCRFAFVETMSFQALGFYQKIGFQLEFTRSGYAHDTSFHYLRMDL